MVGVMLLFAVGGIAWAWAQLSSDDCTAIQRVDLTLEEMADIKRRLDAHQRKDTDILSLSGDEASFLLADGLDYPVWLGIDGDEVVAQLALPDQNLCYNVHFEGRVEVEAGVAAVVPSRLRVGTLDLSGWIRGRRFVIESSLMSGESVAALLDHTESLRVRDGLLEVRIDDPMSLR